VATVAGLSPAHADPLTITTATTTPLRTSDAANGSAGDITVASGGSVITGSGNTITIDTSNNVDVQGSVQSSLAYATTAIFADPTASIATTITENGGIDVTGSGGSGNYGIRIIGAPVTGSIIEGTSGSISVLGDDSYGVSIEEPWTGNIALRAVSVTGTNSVAVSTTAPLAGSLSLYGINSASGSNGIGLYVGGAVAGSVDNEGSIVAGSTATTNSTGQAVPAVHGTAAAWIANSIDSGFLNDRYYVDSSGNTVAPASVDTATDTLVTGTLVGDAGATGLLVAPNAAAPTDIAIGQVGASGTNQDYGIVNLGAITSNGLLDGTSATAVNISGISVSGTDYRVSVAGGLISQANASIDANAIDAAATAISIGPSAIVPAIVNQGTITANTTISGSGPGGAAYGINVLAGGNVSSVTNSGTMTVTSSGSNNSAYGILDQSGALTTVTNSGTITATAASGATARAIDLATGTAAEAVTNSGAITGDIVFGSGGGSYTSNSGTLSGTLYYGAGNDALDLTGTTSFATPIVIASGGALAVMLADTAKLDLTRSTIALNSLNAGGSSVLRLGIGGNVEALQILGGASFTSASTVSLFVEGTPASGSASVLHAAGGLTTDHAASLLDASSVPFLYSLGGYSVTGNDILVTLDQKSAAQLGISSGLAPLYTASLAALGGNGGAAFEALANLPSQAAVLAAYRQIEPVSFGSAIARITEITHDGAAGMISGRVDTLLATRYSTGFDAPREGFWAQEYGQLFSHRDAQDDPGFRGTVYGFGFGTDRWVASQLLVGVMTAFGWADTKINGLSAYQTDPLRQDDQRFDLYAAWRHGPLFAKFDGGVAHDQFGSTSDVTVGTVSSTKSAKWSGYQLSGEATIGGRFSVGRFWLQPSDSTTYIRLHEGGYRENGGGDYDLAVAARNTTLESTTPRLGVGYGAPMGDGRFFVQADGGYLLELKRRLPELNAAFLVGGPAFSLATEELSSHEILAGASAGYEADNWTFRLNLDHRQETGFHDNGVTGTLRFAI